MSRAKIPSDLLKKKSVTRIDQKFRPTFKKKKSVKI